MAIPSGRPLGISFVIRLWLEKRDAVGAPEWRFQVVHVQSGVDMHGRSLDDLLAFIEHHAEVPPPGLRRNA